MNILSFEKQVEIIAALCEGVSIRATERLTDVHRDTIMRLGVRVGRGCAKFHDAVMRDLRVNRIEFDEIWSFIGKKQAKRRPDDDPTLGDCYTFIGLAGASKAILAYRVGHRGQEDTSAFVQDVRNRVVGEPEISSDKWNCYPGAVWDSFGTDCTYGMIEKHFRVPRGEAMMAARRYSPPPVVSVSRRHMIGKPKHISTSYVERQNLTLRMQQRRFTRLTNGFSKKFENHEAAVSLYVSHYNFCRVHEAITITPAMQLGLTDHIWTIGELVEAALNGVTPEPQGRKVGRFRVIDGGTA